MNNIEPIEEFDIVEFTRNSNGIPHSPRLVKALSDLMQMSKDQLLQVIDAKGVNLFVKQLARIKLRDKCI